MPDQLMKPPLRGHILVNVHRDIYLPTREAIHLYEEQFPIAANPETEPALLESLWNEIPQGGVSRLTGNAREAFFAILDALAANPNTPPYILKKIAGKHPDAFALNPILPLLPLEEPGFVDAAAGLEDVLQIPDAPASLVRLMTTSSRSDRAESARYHIALAGDMEPGEDWQAEFLQYLERVGDRYAPPKSGPAGRKIRSWFEELRDPATDEMKQERSWGERSSFFVNRLAAALHPRYGLLARAAESPDAVETARRQEANRLVRAFYRDLLADPTGAFLRL
jgi:hypothetical protein